MLLLPTWFSSLSSFISSAIQSFWSCSTWQDLPRATNTMKKKIPPNRNWKSHLCHRINQGAVVGCWKIPGEKKEKEKKRWKVFPPLLGVRPVFHHFNALPAELRRGRLSRYNLWMVFRQSPHRRHLLKCHLPHNLSTDSLSIVHSYCCSQSH